MKKFYSTPVGQVSEELGTDPVRGLKTDEIASRVEKYGKNAAQICINWLVKNEGITAPIVGGANPAHALENIAALDFELSAEDYDSIDEVSRNFCSQMPEYLLFFDTRTKEDFKEERGK